MAGRDAFPLIGSFVGKIGNFRKNSNTPIQGLEYVKGEPVNLSELQGQKVAVVEVKNAPQKKKKWRNFAY